MARPVTPDSEESQYQDIVDRLARLEQLSSRDSEVLTATSSSIASGATATLTIAHTLGVVPSFVFLELEDGTSAHQCSARVVRGSLDVQVILKNNGPNAATVVVRVVLRRPG